MQLELELELKMLSCAACADRRSLVSTTQFVSTDVVSSVLNWSDKVITSKSKPC